ncbi:hypothetical protein [Niallia circulans]|uniref:hypothetical protein n=1 Tax=Niallia circulans TaxID=1397 RepID=UPI0026F31A60|nr:hypothetical protein [Niallia circulans]
MKFAPTALNILDIKINAIDHGAVVNLGPSQHLDMFLSYKRNQGNGEHNGDMCPLILTTSWIIDNDVYDTSAFKSSFL